MKKGSGIDFALTLLFSVLFIDLLTSRLVIPFAGVQLLVFSLLWAALLCFVPKKGWGLTIAAGLTAVVTLVLWWMDKLEPLVEWITEYAWWLSDVFYGGTEWTPQWVTLTAVGLTLLVAWPMFLLIRFRAHYLFLLLVGSGVFIGLELAGFAVEIWKLAAFALLILLAALRGALVWEARQGRYLLLMTPLCALVLVCALAVPVPAEPPGRPLLEALPGWLEGNESAGGVNILQGNYYELATGEMGSERDLGGRVNLTDEILMYLYADAPFYAKGRSYTEYTGRRWVEGEWRQEAGNPWSGGRSFTYLPADWKQYSNSPYPQTNPPSAEIQRHLAAIRLQWEYGSEAFNPVFEQTEATLYPWNMKTKTIYMPDYSYALRLPASSAVTTLPNLDASVAPALGRDESYFVSYLRLVLTGAEWEGHMNSSHRGLSRERQAQRPPSYQTVPQTEMEIWNSFEVLLAASVQESDWVYWQYTALPDTLPQRVRDLAGEIVDRAGAVTDYERLKALERYLSASFPYTLNVPATPEGEDFVDYFLFELKQGYCVYYASAMVVLARSLGLPARYVEGFVFSDDKIEDFYYAKGSSAHAWVEAYMDGYGWIAFEPTAGRASVNPFPTVPPSAEPTPTPTPTPAVSPTPTPPPEQSVSPTSTPSAVPKEEPGILLGQYLAKLWADLGFWRWVVLATLAIGCGTAAQGLRVRRFTRLVLQGRYNRAGLAMILRKQSRMLAALGLRQGGAETLLEFAARCDEKLERDPAVYVPMAEAVYATGYGEEALGDDTRSAVARAVTCTRAQVQCKRGRIYVFIRH